MPNPNVRIITLQWVNNQMAGDELLELWKKVAGVWSLETTIPVAAIAEQTHEFSGLPGTTYRFAIRGRRDGSYRTDYQSANPDDWPAVSKLDHTAGQPTPVLAFTGWDRTSGVRQILTFSWTNFDTARPTRFWRDDGGGFDLIATIGAGVSTYEYEIQPGEEEETFDFYVDQAADDATSEPSNELSIYAGPEAPSNLSVSPPEPSYSNIWYGYNVEWSNASGSYSTRVEDDYCGAYTSRSLAGGGVSSYMELGLPKDSVMDPNGNVEAIIGVRVRHEVTSFAVLDVSEYVEISVPIDIASDETAIGTC